MCQLMPTQSVCELLSAVSVESLIKTQIQRTEMGHFDETGMRVNEKLMWLNVACAN